MSEAGRVAGAERRATSPRQEKPGFERRPSSTASGTPAFVSACALAVTGALGCAALACTAQEDAAATRRFEVAVVAHSDATHPLAGVSVTRAGVLLGTTDAKGRLELTLEGAEGETASLDWRCPEGHRQPESGLLVGLRRLEGPTGRTEHAVRCPPETRRVVVAVRAEGGAELPLLHLGREVARTDESGAAHALFELPPGTAFRLTLDTAGSEALRPRSPSLSFHVAERDELVVFEQAFTREEPRRAPVRRARGESGPTRL